MSQQINLFNPQFTRQQQHFSAFSLVKGIAVTFLLCAGLVWRTESIMADLRKQEARSQKAVALATQKLNEANVKYAPRQKNKALEQAIASGERELKGLQDASNILERGDFGNSQGFSEYFRALARQSVDGLWLTQVVVGSSNNEFGLRGRAMQADLVPAYFSRLAQESIMRGKSFDDFEIAQQAEKAAKDGKPVQPLYVNFSLQSKLHQEGAGAQASDTPASPKAAGGAQ